MPVKKIARLTDEQKRALAAFRTAQKLAGMPPELKEVAKVMGASKQYADRMLRSLVPSGRLKKVGRYRGYRLVRKVAA